MDLVDFRSLARSAPWRWRTVRLTVSWHGGHGPDGPLRPVGGGPVRAWVDGRHGLRVEDLATGQLLTADWSESPGGWRGTGRAVGAPGERRRLPVRYEDDGCLVGVDDYGVDDPRAPRPRVRADGLVTSRPPSGSGPGDGVSYDGVLWQTYRWVAMLDPVELADGAAPAGDDGRLGREASLSPVDLVGQPERQARPGGVEVVDHHGRPAWEALLAPTEAYDPRCTCCPLLSGEIASRLLALERGAAAACPREPAGGWPAAHRVRLDVGTGIVVELEQVDGRGAGDGWTAVVEAVDERYDRAWFGAEPG